jgi:uncharacterized membrane protein YcaP (DUF421 family)
MDTVLRSTAVYAILLVIFRLAGKRSAAQTTPFDLVLLLIISEAAQQGLVGDDRSLTTAVVIIVTLMGLDIALSLVKQRSAAVDRLIDGVPLVIVEHGRPLLERMQRERIDESDVLAAARQHQGLERMDQIKYAVLERSGGISIVPKARATDG